MRLSLLHEACWLRLARQHPEHWWQHQGLLHSLQLWLLASMLFEQAKLGAPDWGSAMMGSSKSSKSKVSSSMLCRAVLGCCSVAGIFTCTCIAEPHQLKWRGHLASNDKLCAPWHYFISAINCKRGASHGLARYYSQA